MGYLRWTVKPSARLRMLRSICVTQVHCGEIWGRKLGAMTQDWALWWDQYRNNALSSLSWQAKYWHDPSAQQHVLCAVFAVKSMSVKTCLGSGRRGGAWGCSEPGLLEEVWGWAPHSAVLRCFSSELCLPCLAETTTPSKTLRDLTQHWGKTVGKQVLGSWKSLCWMLWFSLLHVCLRSLLCFFPVDSRWLSRNLRSQFCWQKASRVPTMKKHLILVHFLTACFLTVRYVG